MLSAASFSATGSPYGAHVHDRVGVHQMLVPVPLYRDTFEQDVRNKHM